MPRTFRDPNPQISILDDRQTKEQITRQAEKALDLADKLRTAPRLSEEQLERERFQAASNALAASNPLYAAARSASANFLVVPLDGDKPLVKPSDASRDAGELFLWWDRWPSANPGVLLGRVGGLIALRFEDSAAWERFRDSLSVEKRDPDTDRTWTELDDPGGGLVQLRHIVEPFSMRLRGGWGRAFEQAADDLKRQQMRQWRSETTYRVWSYPSVLSGLDVFDFPTRTIAQGVTVLGEGVLPWDGAILEGRLQVEAPMSRPPEIAVHFAKRIGKPRSRRAVAAAREQYEADLRVTNAHWLGEAEAGRASFEAARKLALADHERATKALAKAEEEAAKEEAAKN